ncbi:arylesterase [Cecembia rubra]|nr:arylesterase [Cecembia rubra]
MIRKISILVILATAIFSCSSPKEEKSAEVTAVQETVDEGPKKLILFYGNSLTAGYGIDAEDAFPGLVQHTIDSLDLNYKVINGGLSGDTSASGLTRLDWFLEEEPAIFVLELGANDGLRGISLSETKSNLKAIIQKVKNKYPETIILLAGMQIPPNMGPEYINEFEQMYPDISKEENVPLIPFLLEGVAGNPDLNLPDGIHPTEEGHRIVFTTVWEHLVKLI